MHIQAWTGETTVLSIHLHVGLLYLKSRWQVGSVLLAALDDTGIRAFLYPLDTIKGMPIIVDLSDALDTFDDKVLLMNSWRPWEQ